ncbi:MAG: hypothetical protein MUE78_04675 [Ilumatobacteraceae bacterium]|nr:hypothetical protein [Ilumatobacteraceae bacterium]
MNQVRTRLQSLGLLDRALAATTDEEIGALVEALGDDHREALERIAGGLEVADLRTAITKGRINGTMESIAVILTDACLADCITELGDHSDNPTTEQLQAVLPGIVERHGVAVTRIMLASTVAGEANASAVIRDLLKHDDVVKLPPQEAREVAPLPPLVDDDPEREAVRQKRREAKQRKQEEARARREQSARDRGKA